MQELGSTALTAIIAFASTNIDDIFVLMLFYAQVDATFRRRHVVIGQYLGFLVLIAISTLGYFGTQIIPHEWVGFLGLAPIVLGLRQLLRRGEKEAKDDSPPASVGAAARVGLLGALHPKIGEVAAVTFSNGGDNIGIYIPLFARGDGRDLLVTIAVFLLLVAVWCIAGATLAERPLVARVLDRYGHRIVPFVLIGLGCLILWESGALALLWPW